MKKLTLSLSFLVCSGLFLGACQSKSTNATNESNATASANANSAANNNKPIKIILDSDIGQDCDDAAVMALMHQFADKGER